MHTGIVKWFNAAKGYGFITPNDGGGDVFVHYTEIDGQGYRSLTEGQAVEYECERTPRGLAAKRVVILRDVHGRTNLGPHGSAFGPQGG